MPFSAELPRGRQCYGEGGLEALCQHCLQQQMLQKWPSLPDPWRGPPPGEGRTAHGSFSMAFPSQNTCLPRHDHLSVPWEWVDGKRGHPALLRHSQSCLRELQPVLLANPLLSPSHTLARQPSMPTCSSEAIKDPYVSREPLLASSDCCWRCRNPPRGKLQTAPASVMGPEPLSR